MADTDDTQTPDTPDLPELPEIPADLSALDGDALAGLAADLAGFAGAVLALDSEAVRHARLADLETAANGIDAVKAEQARRKEEFDAQAARFGVAAASARPSPIRALAGRQRRPEEIAGPGRVDNSPQVAIVAAVGSGELAVVQGQQVTAEEAFALTLEHRRSVARYKHTGPRMYDRVVSIHRDVPEERTLHAVTAAESVNNSAKLEAAREAAKADARMQIDAMSETGKLLTIRADGSMAPMGARQAVTAAVCNCAPATPIYDIRDHASELVPFQSGNVSMAAPRGRIVFARTVGYENLADSYTAVECVEGDLAYNDSDGVALDPQAKQCLTAPCVEHHECTIEGDVTCITHSNWGDATWPELTRHLNGLGLVYKARQVENRLINEVATDPITVTRTGAGAPVGAARSILGDVDLAVATWRQRLNLSDSEPLVAWLPRWALQAMRVDLAFGARNADLISQADSTLAAHFASRGVAPRFFAHGPVSLPAGVQDGPLGPFPSSVQWGLWVPGDVAILTMPSLNFGIVRDSVLNGTNQFQTFVEDFSHACLLHEVLWVTSQVCVDGTMAPENADTVDCVGS